MSGPTLIGICGMLRPLAHIAIQKTNEPAIFLTSLRVIFFSIVVVPLQMNLSQIQKGTDVLGHIFGVVAGYVSTSILLLLGEKREYCPLITYSLNFIVVLVLSLYLIFVTH